MTQSSRIMWSWDPQENGSSLLCLSGLQAGLALNEASPLSAAVMETIVANSHRSLSSKGKKFGTPRLARVTRLNGMAVCPNSADSCLGSRGGDGSLLGISQSFSSAMHVDFTPSSSKALSCEI